MCTLEYMGEHKDISNPCSTTVRPRKNHPLILTWSFSCPNFLFSWNIYYLGILFWLFFYISPNPQIKSMGVDGAKITCREKLKVNWQPLCLMSFFICHFLLNMHCIIPFGFFPAVISFHNASIYAMANKFIWIDSQFFFVIINILHL